MNTSKRVIDTLKKEELQQVAKKLNLLIPKTMRKDDLKNHILNTLNSKEQYQTNYIFPKAPIIVAIGDLHGDMEATLKALKLASVIDRNIPNNTKDINKINDCVRVEKKP